jgi:hypothetical protein
MKDRSTIETVIKDMKIEKTQRNFRVFQAMRLMRREYMVNLGEHSSSEDGSSDTNSDEMNLRQGTMMTEQYMLPQNA